MRLFGAKIRTGKKEEKKRNRRDRRKSGKGGIFAVWSERWAKNGNRLVREKRVFSAASDATRTTAFD